MTEQQIEILRDRRSAYGWLLAVVILVVCLGMWFAPRTEQPLFVWLLVAIASLPTSLVFILGTFTPYFDLKMTEKGIVFGGYSGRRKFGWEEITDIKITGGDECPRIAFSLTPKFKNEVEQPRPDEVLPKLYGLTAEELVAKLKSWQSMGLKNGLRPSRSAPTSVGSSVEIAEGSRGDGFGTYLVCNRSQLLSSF